MRPRKRIALYCANPNDRSALTIVLDTRRYRVLIDSAEQPDLYVVVHGLLDAGRSANAYGKRVCAGVPVLAVIQGKSNMARPSYPSAYVLWDPGMETILEAIRILIGRKRGPKKAVEEMEAVK